MIHHPDQDRWDKRAKLGISEKVTVYTPEGEAMHLATKQDVVLYYRDQLQIDLESHYK
jgi:hypothetical protein